MVAELDNVKKRLFSKQNMSNQSLISFISSPFLPFLDGQYYAAVALNKRQFQIQLEMFLPLGELNVAFQTKELLK